MAFDLTTAKPVEAQAPAAPGGFDLSTAQEAPGAFDTVIRGAGLTVRALLEGTAALPLAVADLAAYPVNAISRAVSDETLIPSYQQTFSRGMSELGLPEPTTPGEQLVSAAQRGVASIAGGLGAGQLLASAEGATARGVGDILRTAPGVQATAGGAAGGSGELARQEGASELEQLIVSTLSGLGAGIGASVLAPQRAVTAATTARATPPEVSPQQVETIARTGAQKLGFNFDELDEGLQALMRRNATEAVAVDSDLLPVAVARKAVFESLGMQPTRALITRTFDDAFQEQDLLTTSEGQQLRNIYIANNQAVREQIRQLAPEGARAVDAPTFGEQFRAPIVKGERKAQQLTNRAYDKAMDIEGVLPAETQPLVNYLQDNAVVLASTAAGRPVIARLKQMGVISDKNMVPLEPSAEFPAGSLGYNAMPISLRELSSLRKTVNDAWKGAKRSGDGVAESNLNEMRTILNAAEKEAGGDLFKSYRLLRQKKGKRFENNPLIDDLLGDKRGYFGTDKIPDSEVFKKAVINSNTEQFQKVWPRLLPQAKELTRAQVAKYIEDSAFSTMGTNEAADIVASAAKLNQAINSINPIKLKTIYGSEKAAKLERLNTALREISNPPRGTVPQGSAPKLQALTRGVLKVLGATSRVPLIGDIGAATVGAVERGAATRVAKESVARAIKPIPAIPAELSRVEQFTPALPGVLSEQFAQ